MAVIGITGLAQNGKSSAAKRLEERWNYEPFAFADRLKSMALVLDPFVPINHLGWDHSDEEVDELMRLSALVTAEGWEKAKAKPEVRRFLQVLGTEGARGHFGPNVWVDALDIQLSESYAQDAVISDVRFQNEVDYVKELAGTMLRVVRIMPDGQPFRATDGAHASERDIIGLPVDYELPVRDGDMDSLYHQVDIIAHSLAREV